MPRTLPTTLNASSIMMLLVQFVGEVSNYKPKVTCVPKSLTCIMQVHYAHAHCQSVEVNTDMPTSTTKSLDGRNKNSTTILKTCHLEALLATSNMARKKTHGHLSGMDHHRCWIFKHPSCLTQLQIDMCGQLPTRQICATLPES